MTTTNLSEFGFRELEIAEQLLTAMSNNGLPDEFVDEGVTIMFNTHSGYVFLTNDEYQAAILSDDEDVLEMFYTTPYDGHEGTLADLIEDYEQNPDDWNDEDAEFLEELKNK